MQIAISFFFNKLNNRITEIVHELNGQPSYNVSLMMFNLYTAAISWFSIILVLRDADY